jgi:hypothetical protein
MSLSWLLKKLSSRLQLCFPNCFLACYFSKLAVALLGLSNSYYVSQFCSFVVPFAFVHFSLELLFAFVAFRVHILVHECVEALVA